MPPANGSDPGWNVVKVTDLKPVSAGIALLCDVVYGPAYGTQAQKELQIDGPAIHAMYRKAGFSRRGRKQVFPRDLVGMYFLVNLVLTDKNETGLTFWESEQAPSLVTRNKLLISERRKPCPINKTHPCAFCNLGKNECARAVRPITVETKNVDNSDQVREQGQPDQGHGR